MLFLVELEVSEELLQSFAGVDPASVEQVFSRDGVLVSERVDVGLIEELHPHPHGLAHLLVDGEPLEHQELLGLGVEEKRARELEHLAVDAELQRRLVVRRGNEDALLRRHLEAVVRRIVEVGEEDQQVEGLVLPLQVLDELGHHRPLAAEPLELLLPGGLSLVDLLGETVELLEVALSLDGESDEPDSACLVLARGKLVLPGDVVLRGRGEDRDVVAAGEPLGELAGEGFRPPQDLPAEALNDERDLHAQTSSMKPRSSVCTRWGAKRSSLRLPEATTLFLRSSSVESRWAISANSS